MPTDTVDAQQPTAHLAVMFADISGSTKIYESAGDRAAHTAINAAVDLMRQQVVAVGGRVIKTIGDEVMATCPNAQAAAQAACAIHRQLAMLPPVQGGASLGARIGMYAGPVIERDGDVFGDTVNMAARMADLAHRDQIITTVEIIQMMEPATQGDARFLYATPVKGKAEPAQLYELLWRAEDDNLTMMATRRHAGPVTAPVLKLRLVTAADTQHYELNLQRSSMSFGRDASADILINEKMASRSHGNIERRIDKYVLTDHSANGTYVLIEGEKEQLLRREQMVLRGVGQISLGRSCEGAELVLHFSLVESS